MSSDRVVKRPGNGNRSGGWIAILADGRELTEDQSGPPRLRSGARPIYPSRPVPPGEARRVKTKREAWAMLDDYRGRFG